MKRKVLALAMATVMLLATACGTTSSGQAPAAAPAVEAEQEAEETAAEETTEETATEEKKAEVETAVVEETAEEAETETTPLEPKNGEQIVVGYTCLSYSDTHLSNIRNAVNMANEEAGNKYVLDMIDDQADLVMQWNNINTLVNKGADIIASCYYQLDNWEQLFELCADNGNIPIIAYNTNSPDTELIEKYKDIFYFVSSAAEASGRIQGELAAEYWKEHPEADRNGNGVMDYVMLMGNPGLYDTEMRTKHSVEAVKNAGIEVNCIIESACEFNRAKAMDSMASIITANYDDVDVVFSNNDDMALGAIEALKAAGFFNGEDDKYIPVLGVDATAVGLEALKEGTLLGTSLNNPVVMGRCIYLCIDALAKGEEVTQEMLDNAGFETAHIDEYHRIWLDYIPITAENIDDADLSKY